MKLRGLEGRAGILAMQNQGAMNLQFVNGGHCQSFKRQGATAMKDLFHVLGAIGVALWKAFNKKRPPARSRSGYAPASNARTQRRPVSQEFHWPGTGAFEFEIVGESYYQRALSALAGQHGEVSAEVQFLATLVLEDSNEHDPKAVAVRIEQYKVGHLSREDARSYRRRLGQKQLSGVNATCDAIVVGGGTRHNGERLMYGVKLDIKPFG